MGGTVLTQVSGLRYPSSLTCSGGWFAWPQDDASFALRAGDGLLVRLGSRHGANDVQSSEESLIWADEAPGTKAPIYNGVLLPSAAG